MEEKTGSAGKQSEQQKLIETVHELRMSRETKGYLLARCYEALLETGKRAYACGYEHGQHHALGLMETEGDDAYE